MDAEADQLCGGGGANSRNGRCEQSPAACVGMLTLRIPSCASVASSRRTSSSATSTSTEPSWPPWPGCTPRASFSPSSGARFLRHAARHRRHLRGCSVRSRRCSPGARYQRCTVHFYRNALGRVPVTRRKAAARMLKAIHAQESREVCARKAEEVAEKLESMRLRTAARTMRNRFAKTLAYTEFPSEHWRQIKTNNRIERINREIRRRTRVVGIFPDGNSVLMLVAARLKHKVKQEEIPGYIEGGGDERTEGKDGGLKEDGAEDG
ncbi:hypothetical protein DXC18_00520 [Collinsella sp. OM08-14AT]|nr:hypothetical protein DXC18_00520 [Collinsella sp. OM08-14AT]